MKSLYETIFDTTVTPEDFCVRPKSKGELQQIITAHIKRIKPHPGEEVDLNWIDISKVDDLNHLFMRTEYVPVIDTWKIDHVEEFRGMFADNKYIVRSPLPRLQTKLLQIDCYGDMFLNCTSLQVAPELPAMELTNFCYNSMFRNCTSLTHAPELPAKELTEACYHAMFEGCSSLTEAPALPAIKLETNCYDGMFKNCKSLKNKAKTPIDKPISEQYALGMYKGCPNIKD